LKRLLELLLSPLKDSHGIEIHLKSSKSIETETIDLFIGYTNQKGKRTDIAQRANPPSHRNGERVDPHYKYP
jgi:hypothetical protein